MATMLCREEEASERQEAEVAAAAESGSKEGLELARKQSTTGSEKEAGAAQPLLNIQMIQVVSSHLHVNQGILVMSSTRHPYID